MLSLAASELMAGKAELCALSEKDVENEGIAKSDKEQDQFDLFSRSMIIFQTQSDVRQLNIGRKR
jgi:hypothetical protein